MRSRDLIALRDAKRPRADMRCLRRECYFRAAFSMRYAAMRGAAMQRDATLRRAAAAFCRDAAI